MSAPKRAETERAAPTAFSPNRFALTLLAWVAVGWVALMGGLLAVGLRFDPPPGRMLVLFAGDLEPDEALRRVLSQGGLLIGDGVAGRLWTVYADDPAFANGIRSQGALALWRSEAFDWMFSTGCTGDTSALTRAQPPTH